MFSDYCNCGFKRSFDFFFSLFLLLLCLPIFILVPIIIRLSSPGPVFYIASRCGIYGRTFKMYKFRTMHVHTNVSSKITLNNDSRVFFAGHILRLLKIDEIPQLLNILIGQMSFVGPRPEDPSFVDNYYLPWMHKTLDVKPGLTCVGSIFGTLYQDSYLDDCDSYGSYVRNLLPLKLALDRHYLERSSFLLDIWIMILTLFSISIFLIARYRIVVKFTSPCLAEMLKSRYFIRKS